MTKSLNYLATLTLLGLVAVAVLLFAFSHASPVQGSVVAGNEYIATTTNGGTGAAEKKLKTGYGALAQVTITGANTGFITLYDATTSNVNLRTGQKASSTIVIADFPASVAAGTYTFDDTFSNGLLLETTGTPATSTISYR